MRIVQYSPNASDGKTDQSGSVDTHLLFKGRADDGSHGKLMRIVVRTCYLHATLAAALSPILT